MKKTKRLIMNVLAGIALTAMLCISCKNSLSYGYGESGTESVSRAATKITTLSSDSNAISYNSTYSMYTIRGSAITNGWNYATIDLSAFSNQTVKIDFGTAMQVQNNGGSTTLAWQVNTSDYPIVASKTYNNGSSSWEWVSGSLTVTLGKNNVLYLSTYNTTPKNLTINVGKPDVTVTTVSGGSTSTSTGTSTGGSTSGSTSTTVKAAANVEWKSAPSLYQTYKKYFDYFGIAVEYGTNGDNQLAKSDIQKGLAYQANSITMGNEFKPDFIFNWATPNQNGSFTSSSGTTIRVPTNTPNFDRVDKILTICKNNGLKMRGHVLVWHSQTPAWFFHEDYNTSRGLVSKDVMNARLEWYVKTVIEHVTNWEKNYNNGNHIIWAWDVVNEAAADDASGNNFLRGSTSNTYGGSKWYSVYGNDDFIVNAFRYANKYAPKDVLLCYNDYNCYMSNKTDAIIRIINDVQAYKNSSWLPSRLDAIGMQSHVSYNYPGVSGFETAVKKFINKGIDVQITEFDLANGSSSYNQSNQAALYKSYFKMFVNNRKTSGKHGISSVTVWGIDDNTSWLQSNYSTRQYPLLFTQSNGKIVTKPEFVSVIEAAQ